MKKPTSTRLFASEVDFSGFIAECFEGVSVRE
jgi:hypothetical protein